MNKLSVYIVAYNEADKIRAAITSVTWADEILVADSDSTDGTAEIAGRMGAKVVQIPFIGFGDLRNRAIRACRNEWIFSLDSDERCTPQVKAEIQKLLAEEPGSDAYYVPRKNFFLGKWIRFSGFYPDYRQPQLFRKGALIFEPDAVHERYRVQTDKPLGYLKNPIHQIPYKNIEEMLEKANRYSSLGAQRLHEAGRASGMTGAFFHAAWSFFSLYLLKAGFLDGWAGFLIAFGNFQGTFYKYAKLFERRNALDYRDDTPDGQD
jgi:glycosyltransferase involved in cell wall biosynthesis